VRNSRTWIAICLLATWTVWGSTYLAIKYALVSFPPFAQMGSRFVVAGLLVLAWSHARGATWPRAAEWRNAAVAGLLMMVGGMGLTAYAEQTIASSLAVVFVACIPMLILLFGRWLGEAKPRPLETLGVLVGFAGVVLLAGGQGFRASPAGLAAMTAAVTGWSLGSVLSRRRLPLAPGAMGYGSQMLCGGVLLGLVSLATGEHVSWPPAEAAALAWLYLVVFGSLVAFNAYMFLLSAVRPSLASSYTLVCPVVGLALGVAWGGERLSAQEWTASLVILTGLVLVLAGAFRRTQT
jgi:drug/metabolite transporter (DMT)-like permease